MKAQQYNLAFDRERRQEYPIIDRFETNVGYAVDRDRLESAARVLACPVKVNLPNWQHGRVIYSTLMRYLRYTHEPVIILDIGTAKGFSACVMTWAIAATHHTSPVVSIDMMDPCSRVRRNSVGELDGFKTVHEFVAPYIDTFVPVEFLGGGSLQWLQKNTRRIGFAFVDGKHTYDAVTAEYAAISKCQDAGDIIIFDDLQIEPVHRAVSKLKGYDVIELKTEVGRKYAIAVKE